MNALVHKLKQIPAGLTRRFDERLALRAINRDRKFWEQTRGSQRGKRAFIIGNGPSLRFDDLDRLANEVTFACNRIYLAWPRTKWRPTYITVADQLVWKKFHREISESTDRVFIPHFLVHAGLIQTNTLVYQGLPTVAHPFSGTINFSDNAVDGIWSGWTVTVDNIQLALHMGCDPLYIVGCDHCYEQSNKVSVNQPIEVKDEQNHFVKGYRQRGELVNPAPVKEMESAYRHARAFCEQKGIGIFNATRGGRLEIFERTDLDTILAEKG